MAIPRPRVPPPPLPRLSAALQELGLPPVVRCDPLAPPWVHANYRLGFPADSGTPDLLLRRRLTDPGHDTFAHELAGLTALRASDLPVVRNYRVLPHGTLPWPAVLSDLLPGGQGFRLIRKLPEHASAICQATGALVRRLEHEIRPNWATDVDGDRFVPRRASWREEWADHCWSWWSSARAAGTDLGPLGQAVFDALQARLQSLDTADRWCVVHGDLHPSNLLFEAPTADGEPPRLSGIVDWEGALVGDPLLEWALLVELPDATLGHVLTGLGEDRVREVLDDADALARLETYRLSRAIRRLAFGAMSLFRGDGGIRRSYALEYGRVVCLEAVERPLSEKLEAALASGTSGDVIQKVPAPPIHRVVWQGIESLRYRPALQASDHALHLCAALAGVLCDVRHQGLSVELCRRIGPQAYPERGAPLADRAATFDEVLDRALEHGRPMALASVALVSEALGRLARTPSEWPVGDDAIRGLDVIVRKLHAAEPAQATPAGKLAEQLIGLAALQALADQRDTTEAQVAAIDRVRLAWEDLTLFGNAPTDSVEPSVVRDHWAEQPDLDRPLVVVLLWALEHLTDGLPAVPARVLGALGLTPGDEE